MRRKALTLLLMAAAMGCGDDVDLAPTAATPPAGCLPGERSADDGSCISAGLPADMTCPPGQWQHEGNCVPAGVPPNGCAVGFEHSEEGCEPLLPSAPCPPGEMAVLGSTQCREVAPCGSGTWGNIVTDAETEHVDGSYSGGNSNGSASAPWTTITAAINAAPPGGTVAVAAGSYAEDLFIYDWPVTLWGRCPAMVEIVGTGMFGSAVEIQDGAAATVIRGLAITGDAAGVLLSGSLDVTFEQLWIHDTSERGLSGQATVGPTSFTLRDTLIDGAVEYGVYLSGVSGVIDGSVIRDTQLSAQESGGRGISTQPAQGTPTMLTLRSSIVENNRGVGVHLGGSQAQIEGSVIRDTQPDMDGHGGRAISAKMDDLDLFGASLTLSSSVLDGNHEVGLHVEGSEAVVESTVIRGTQPNGLGQRGSGVSGLIDTTTLAPAVVAIHASLIDDNTHVGVLFGSSQLSLSASVVRNTRPNANGSGGRGVEGHVSELALTPSSIVIDTSLIDGNSDVGVYGAGSELTLTATAVQRTLPRSDGSFGRGVNVQASLRSLAGSNATVSNVLIDSNHEVGLFSASSVLTVEHGLIRNTLVVGEDGIFGDGVVTASITAAGHTTLDATRIENSARASVSNYGGTVALSGSQMVCQTFDIITNDWESFVSAMVDDGNNGCGCPEPTDACRRSGSSEPPPPVGGLE